MVCYKCRSVFKFSILSKYNNEFIIYNNNVKYNIITDK